MIAIFYSFDGRIWYWGKYTKEEIAELREQGTQVLRDTPNNRRKLR